MTEPLVTNRRRFERVNLSRKFPLACQAHGEGVHLDGEVTVLSAGGMFIRTPKVQPVGSRFEVKMRNIADVVEAECIVRNNHHEGFGVEFLEMKEKYRSNLERIIERLRDPA